MTSGGRLLGKVPPSSRDPLVEQIGQRIPGKRLPRFSNLLLLMIPACQSLHDTQNADRQQCAYDEHEQPLVERYA